MSAPAERYRKVAAGFGRVVDGVDDWDAPTPCEGWVARDVVAHLCEWVPAYFAGTWDLARATAQPEALDADEVRAMLAGIEPMIDALVASGHYGPPVPVPDGADEQTRLLGFLGRSA